LASVVYPSVGFSPSLSSLADGFGEGVGSSEGVSVDVIERGFRTENIMIGAPGLRGWSSGISSAAHTSVPV